MVQQDCTPAGIHLAQSSSGCSYRETAFVFMFPAAARLPLTEEAIEARNIGMGIFPDLYV